MGMDNFEDIIKADQQSVHKVVFLLVRNETDADEIVQQTFVSAFRCLKKFRGDSSIETWLIKIAINNTRTYFRKRNFLSLFYDAGEKAIDIKDDRQNTEGTVENEAVKKAVDSAVAKLPLRQKEVFVMKHLSGFSISEISQALDIAQGSVKANLFKAIKNLKKYMENSNAVW